MSLLDGIWIKVTRASEHLKAFQAQLNEFRRGHPYSIIPELDSQTGDQIWKVDTEPTQPPPFPVIGDVLYNLRSALDHLAWQLVLKADGTPTNQTEFPIFNDPERFTADSPRKVAGMNQAMKDRIKAAQPCFGNRNLALWSLHEYGNTDKHRTLITTVTSTPRSLFWEPPGNGPVYAHDGPVQKGTVLARFAPPDMKSLLSIMPSIAFGEAPAAGKDVEHTLKAIELRVTALVKEFEAAFF